MVSITFFTFSLMMPSHREGSSEFPEILRNGRTMVEQGILVLAEGLPEAGRPERPTTLSTSGDTQNSQASPPFKALRVARDGSWRHDTT
jgi:hypothetical protein